MRRFLATVAIAALATASVQADPGGGKGNGGGNGGGGKDRGAAMQGGGGNNGGGNSGGGKAERGAMRAIERGGPDRVEMHAGRGDDRRMEMPVRGNDRGELRGNSEGRGKAKEAWVERDSISRGSIDRGRDMARSVITRDADKVSRVSWRGFNDNYDRGGLLDGCPPGLAKKNNGCMPPGQLKDRGDWGDWSENSNLWGIRSIRDLDGYRYYDGSLVRFGPSGISSYYPLLGGALAIGNPWPTAYSPVSLDPYYVDYYGLGNDYRYFDGALYRLDPETQAISAIAGLLTGDEFAVGQALPVGYDVYNVPYAYRDRYADNADNWYRYSDGYVYQVNPKTRLIVAALELLS